MTQEHAGRPRGGAPMSPHDALAELCAGNDRFVAGTRIHPNQDAERRAALLIGQHPFAVIFGCSDSRLAAEIIFDRGLGDLFLVRTAGHVVGPEVLGSIEYAVTVLDTPLVVVLGHDFCGAVDAANQAVTAGSHPAGHLGAVVAGIAPSVHAARAGGVHDVNGIVDVHIDRTVRLLPELSGPLAEAIADQRCTVVGMSYQLADGRARILEPGRPQRSSPAVAAGLAGTPDVT
ncbi:MAG TPA: carbonic anhydrase [Micromonosporaceae bacterium]|nr:carbonic anhydrase [Micromonosporaceae bacterium]